MWFLDRSTLCWRDTIPQSQWFTTNLGQLLHLVNTHDTLFSLTVKQVPDQLEMSSTVLDSPSPTCLCAVQVVRGGVHQEGGAGADPPAAAARHLGDRGGETGAGEGASGQGERPAGRHETAGSAGERERGGARAIPGQRYSSAASHVTSQSSHSKGSSCLSAAKNERQSLNAVLWQQEKYYAWWITQLHIFTQTWSFVIFENT